MRSRDPFELEALDQRLDRYSDEGDDGPEDCPSCGEGIMMIHSEIDGQDADGNRGWTVTWRECNICGYSGEDDD